MINDEISVETFFHLVELAALELDEQEAEYLRRELNNQLKAIHELEAIPVEANLSISSHGILFTHDISASLRQDEWEPYSNTKAIIEQTPQNHDGYIVVPDIPHQTLK